MATVRRKSIDKSMGWNTTTVRRRTKITIGESSARQTWHGSWTDRCLPQMPMSCHSCLRALQIQIGHEGACSTIRYILDTSMRSKGTDWSICTFGRGVADLSFHLYLNPMIALLDPQRGS